MKDASIKILAALSEKGYRVTDARRGIVELLARQEQPITTQALAKKVESDEASVYRTVRMLVNEGFLEEVELQGETVRYALAHEHGHHHHVVCTECGFVAHAPCESISVQKKLPDNFKKISTHEVTLYGICSKCG